MKRLKNTKYKSKLNLKDTETGIKLINDNFEKKLAEKLGLQRVTAPLFLPKGTGLQDDLAGTQNPVQFKTEFSDKTIEMLHSLAKWKRYALKKYGFKKATGLYTDMNAIRKDEDVDDLHSIYVDQWDWEFIISKNQKNLNFLKKTVKKIYRAIFETEKIVNKQFPKLKPQLPEKITFIHAEDLENRHPNLTPEQREDEIAKKHGAVFVIGIGYPLKSGRPHDLRAADYDDWTTKTEKNYHGLNGDILIWDKLKQKTVEISSMGIRVDAQALRRQLTLMNQIEKEKLEFHKKILSGKLPLSIGGGIGQSRLCMLLLQKMHIGEVQVSFWPEKMVLDCEKKGIELL